MSMTPAIVNARNVSQCKYVDRTVATAKGHDPSKGGDDQNRNRGIKSSLDVVFWLVFNHHSRIW